MIEMRIAMVNSGREWTPNVDVLGPSESPVDSGLHWTPRQTMIIHLT